MSSIETPISLPPLATLPPPIEEPLGPPIEPSSVASPSSSMEIAPSSLSLEKTSPTSSIPTSITPVDLATLIFDTRRWYAPPDLAPKSLSPATSASVGYASPFDPSDESFAQDSLSDSASENDLVPILALKKGARNRMLTSSKEVGSGSKNPYVFNPAFLTWACRNSSYGSTAIPNPTIPKSKFKPLSQRKLLKGKMVFPSSDTYLTDLLLKTEAQVWILIFLNRDACVAKEEVVDFIKNFSISRFSGDFFRTSVSKVLKRSMSPYHKFLFTFVIRNLIPRQERRDAASYLDLTLMELLDRGMPINLPALMIAYLNKVVHDFNQNHALPYGFLLTSVFAKLGVKFSSMEHYLSYDAFDYYESRGTPHNTHLRFEIEQLKSQPARNEDTARARHQDLMALIQSLSRSIVPSSSMAPPTDPNP
ncbi:hypothetical protein HAX54_012251 [Datura stramonium]|uniref:Uncharacterized protein n=1 Tax=Datura stramonium TaxID=4076 RepID=A0ABS8TL20_DATST|nr:hypothetical protein [Datura stramonium]